MKKLAFFAFAFLLAGLAVAGEGTVSLKSQKTCPISGKPVDGSFYADVEGFRVLTAGPAEADAVRQNPGNAFATLAKKREAASPVAWICPSMMNPVTDDYPFVQQNGKRIYYCCPPCKSRISRDFSGSAATMKKLAEKNG